MIYGMCTLVVYFHFAINSARSYMLLIFSCTTIASIFTYVKCIVSYYCSRENKTIPLNNERLSLLNTEFVTKYLANCRPYFTTLQCINNLETKKSYKRTVYLKTLKFF